MPTSDLEAKKIVRIIGDYLPPDEACELSQRLDEEVGVHTTNESLKVSLKMLHNLFEQQLERPESKITNDLLMYRTILFSFYALVVFHVGVVIVNVTTFFFIPLLVDWYLMIPLMSLLMMLNFSRNIDCPLTRLENFLRVRLGRKRIGGFVGHYFIRPWKRYRKSLTTTRGQNG